MMFRDDSRRRSKLERRITRRVGWLELGTGLTLSTGGAGGEGLGCVLLSSGVGSSWKSHHMVRSWTPSSGYCQWGAAHSLPASKVYHTTQRFVCFNLDLCTSVAVSFILVLLR